MTDDEYAGEVIRIIDILSRVVPESRAVLIATDLEDSAKEVDGMVAHLLSHLKIIEKYDVHSYDGIELKAKYPDLYTIHFVRSGSWSIRNLCESNLMAPGFYESKKRRLAGIWGWFRSFFENENYHSDLLLEWFRKDLEYTKWRLDKLDESGTISILDSKKVRIVKMP